jgi:F0F1-type ATP synthase assembly protein I
VQIVEQIERLHGSLVLGLALVIWLASTREIAISVVAGGALIWLSVWIFKQLFAFLVRRHPARRRLAIALLFAKLPLLWGVMWLIARAHIALDGLGLAAGITCFPVAATVVAVVRRADIEA